MQEKYIKNLPSGYQLRDEITPHKGIYPLVCVVTSIITFIVLSLIGGVYFKDFDILISPFALVLYFAPGFVLYMFVYTAACGLMLKLLTKGEVEYSVNKKYCSASMPNAFIDLKTRVLAGVLPAAAFTLILAGGLIVSVPVRLLYLFLSSAATCHAMLLVMEIRVLLRLRKYKGQGALINTCGSHTAVFVNDGGDDKPDQTTTEYLEWLSNEACADGGEREKRACRVRSFGIKLFSMALVLFSFCFVRILTVKYPVYESIWTTPLLYIVLMLAGLIIYFASIKGRHHFLRVGIVAFVLASLFASWFLTFGCIDRVSHTTDVKNYGDYDKYVQYVPDFFPEEITDDMTPIKYWYYYDASWDTVYEIYLEVELTESSYDALVSKYENDLHECWYADGYLEYVISDDLGHYSSDDDFSLSSHPDIQKIVFNEADKTVIYELMYGIDPFFFENSAYFDRFDLDPMAYIKHISKD